jgi:hypothetical protein
MPSGIIARAVPHHDRIEPTILEALQTLRACYLGVKALVAKLAVAVLNGAQFVIAQSVKAPAILRPAGAT